jgi:hypothetical protein
MHRKLISAFLFAGFVVSTNVHAQQPTNAAPVIAGLPEAARAAAASIDPGKDSRTRALSLARSA